MAGGPLSAPQVWDVMTVGGVPLPGLAKVKAKRKYKTDVKNAAGADGATLTGLGHEPTEASITLRIWTEAHWEQLKTVAPLLMPPPKKGLPSPVDVSHPTLAFLKVRSLYFTEIGAPEESSRGVWEVELVATEYLPIKGGANVTKTPLGANAKIGNVEVHEKFVDPTLLPDGTYSDGTGQGVIAPKDDPGVTGP
jgi:hypothetical protein